MKYFKIENGSVTDTIVADANFISSISGTWIAEPDGGGYGIGDNYDGTSFSKPSTTKTQAELEKEGRAWRDEELSNTDWIVSITDHSQRSSYLTYRANLRDWPSTSDFPNTKPTL